MAKKTKEIHLTFPTTNIREARTKVTGILNLIDKSGGAVLGIKVLYYNKPVLRQTIKRKKKATPEQPDSIGQ